MLPTTELPPVTEADSATADKRPSRRTVLRGAGLAVAVGGSAIGLAACGTDTPTTTTPSASDAAPSSATSSSAAAPSSAASSSAAAPSGPSVATADVPVGGGTILSDADYVVTQPTEGDFKAFTKICTHMKCPVTEIEGSDIVCKCHGSKFSIKDGSVTNGPATSPLEEFATTVSGDNVVISA